jgi:RND superfamily putative drug exporter
MTLLGDRNWYLPKWLEWLPDVRIEGPAEPASVPDASAGLPDVPRPEGAMGD